MVNKRLPSDVAGSIRAEKHNRLSNFRGLTDPIHWHHRPEIILKIES